MTAGRSAQFVEFVRQTALFADLPEDRFRAIASRIRFSEEPRGRHLFRQDEPARTFFLVLEGWVKVYRVTPGGDEAIIGIFTRGQSFAEIAAFAGRNYPANSETVTDATLAAIPIQAIVSAIGRNSDVALAMLASISRHVRHLVDEIEQMKGYSGHQRVAEFLIEQSPVDKGACAVRLPYEKSLIAAKLGMKAESLSRVFQRMRRYGVVIKHDMAIISDIDMLREALDPDGSPASRVARRGI